MRPQSCGTSEFRERGRFDEILQSRACPPKLGMFDLLQYGVLSSALVRDCPRKRRLIARLMTTLGGRTMRLRIGAVVALMNLLSDFATVNPAALSDGSPILEVRRSYLT